MSPPIWASTPEQVRRNSARAAASLPPGPRLAHVTDFVVRHEGGVVRCRRYAPGPSPVGTIVYYHGGGWVTGAIESVDHVCRTLALASECEVVSVGYRLAPEAPFPAAVDDAYAALCHVASRRSPGHPVTVAGDSSGGNLAAVCARWARDRRGPRIDLQLLVHPVTDHDFTRGSYERHGNCGLIGQAEMEWFWDQYVPADRDRDHPDAAPLRASELTGLPPAYIALSGHDPLRDEGEAYACRLRAAGVEVTVDRYETMVHGFVALMPLLSAGRRAVHQMGRRARALARRLTS